MPNETLRESGDVQDDGGRLVKVRGSYRLPRSDGDSEAAGDPVKQFLIEHAEELRLPEAEALRVVHSATTPLGRVVRFSQQLDGLPVLDTEILVATNPEQDRVVQIDLAREPELEVTATRSGDQPVTAEEARRSVLAELGGPSLRIDPPPPTEAWFPAADGLRRAWVVLVATRQPEHDWRFVVDATTGRVLDRQDLIRLVDGSGLVFDPNPVVTGGDPALRDPDATLAGCGFAGSPRELVDAQRVTRPLRGITRDAGTGRHRLDGPFVAMRNFGPPSTTFPEEVDPDGFTYSSADPRFEAVNVYYAIDTFQRYLQDPTRGPAVTTAHNSPISCDPHEGADAAFYSPIDKGLHFSDSGPCRPDRAEDAHVMIHEYGHAIQDDQVPGWGVRNPTTGRRETRAMGEGYGDMAACIFFAEHGVLPAVFEPWVFGDRGGLRRVDGAKVYPRDWVDQEHADGEIWSAALWNAYLALGGDSAVPAVRASARDAVIKTVTLSHHLLGASASMPEGAEAVLRTDAALPTYRGRHLTALLDSFHARGILAVDPAAALAVGAGSRTGDNPDLWLRQADDGGTTHQAPLPGQDVVAHARVHNAGPAGARAFAVTFAVRAVTGDEFRYPDDFLPPAAAGCAFDLPPGASTVVTATLPAALLPAAGTPARLIAAVHTPSQPLAAGTLVGDTARLAQHDLAPILVDATDL
jgi:hypothetical protein